MADTSATALELPLLEANGARSMAPSNTPQTPPKVKCLRFIRQWLAETWRDLLADLKEVQWAGGIPWIPLYLFMLAVNWQALMSLAFDMHGFSDAAPRPGCRPDGSYGFQEDYNPWSIRAFFEITPRTGSLSFTEAKVIDVAWDLVVGRVGQPALFYYSWKAFSSYVRVSMETGPVTFDTFYTMHLEEAASIKSTVKMIRDFSTRQHLRSRLAMIFMIINMLFILAWPTLAGSMTGYTPIERPMVIDVPGNLIRMDAFIAVAYVIHDGWRLNLTGNHLIAYDEQRSNTSISGTTGDDQGSCVRAYSADPCDLGGRVSDYVRLYGFDGLDDVGALNDIETEWMGMTLAKSSLNISAFHILEHTGLSGRYGAEKQDPNSSNRSFTLVDSNTTYSLQYILENGTCTTINLAFYQWGFSILQLFINVLLLLLWAIGVWLLWLKAYKELKRRGGVEVSSRYRAILDLASAVDQEVSRTGEPAMTLTNKQLAAHVKQRLHGGAIKVDTRAALSQYKFRTSFWPWAKKHKWWVLLFLLTSWMVPMSVFPATFGASIATALLIGKTTRTRILFFVSGSAVFAIVTVPIFVLSLNEMKFRGNGAKLI